MNVLYIEDYAIDAELVRDAMLKRAPDIRLDIVSSVSDAIARLHRYELAYADPSSTDKIEGTYYSAALSGVPQYDVVLTDLGLPDGSGFDILAHVRRRSLPLAVVFLTGSGQQESVFNALHAGADDYVTKGGDYLTALPATLRAAHQHFQDEFVRLSKTLQVLYAEPNQADADLALRELSRNAPQIQIEWVQSAGEVLSRLAAVPGGMPAIDVLLLDFRMPGMTAIDLVKELHQIQGMDLPIVLVTGHGSEELARTAMKLGVYEYVVKSPGYLERLPFALENAYYRATNMRERMALIKSEREFHSLADHLPDVIARFDRDNRHLYVNPVIEKITGLPAAGFIGKTNSDLGMPADQVALWNENIQRAFASGQQQKIDFSFLGPAGDMYFDALLVPERSSAGKVETVLVISRNITSRWQAEQALRRRERQLDTLIDNFPGMVTHVDQNMRYLNVNAVFEQIIGMPREQILSLTIPDTMSPQGFAQAEPRIKRVLAGEKIALEIEYPDPATGQPRFGLLNMIPDLAEDGTVQGLFQSRVDITDLKLTQLRLQQREAEMRLIADQFPGILSRLDHDLRIVFANAQHEKLYERPLAEIVGLPIMELSGAERFKPLEQYYRRALAGEITTYEANRLNAAGEIIYWFVTLVPDLAKDQTVQGVLVSALDITERKKTELALLKREQELSVITNQFPGTISRLDRDLRYRYVNEAVTVVYQRPREAILGHTMEDVIGTERFARIETEVRKALAGERRVFDMTLYDPSGAERYAILNLIPDLADDGTVQGLFNIVLDITDTRRAELAVRERERELSVITSQFPGIIARLDQDLRYLFVNEAFVLAFKRPKEKIIGITHRELIGPAHFADSESDYRKALAGERRIFDRSYSYSSGEEGHFIINLVPDVAGDGAIQGLFIIGLDVTDVRRAELSAIERERHLTIIANNFPGVISRLDRDLRILFANTHHELEYGTKLEYIVGKTIPQLIGAARFARIEKYYQKALLGERVTYEIDQPDGSGGTSYWIINLLPDIAPDKTVQGIFVNAIDITERKQQENRIERLSRMQAMHTDISSAVVRIHERHALLQEVCAIIVKQTELGMARVALHDEATNELYTVAWWGGGEMSLLENYRVPLYGKNEHEFGAAGRAVLTGKTVLIEDIQSDTHTGYLRQEAIRNGYRSAVGLPLIVDKKAIGALVLYAVKSDFFNQEEVRLLEDLSTDIAVGLEYLAKAEHINYLAYYDKLTDLPNRVSLVKQLEEDKDQSAGRAVALIDIARLRLINDSFGREAGDQIIKLVAERLRRCGFPIATLARIESNCFGLILHELTSENLARPVVEEIVNAVFASPFRLAGNDFHIKAKCGVELIDASQVLNAEVIIRHAELALIEAKQSVETVLFYQPGMDQHSIEMLNIETRLRRALVNQEFVLYYQPKLNQLDQDVTSVEALIRWQDPETGLVPPGLFIPVLEKTGMIFDVGRWVLRQAAADYERWQAMGIQAPRIAVNVSSLQLGHHRFVEDLQNVVAGRATTNHGIDLEITESVIMNDLKENIAKLEAACALGMNIAVDDFGTGYSSLSYLSKLPVNTLKIDRSFVLEMTTGESGRLLVASIINLAHTLKLKVVAEGVETQEQLDMLSGFGCDQIQGYLISKPLPSAELEKWLLQRPVHQVVT